MAVGSLAMPHVAQAADPISYALYDSGVCSDQRFLNKITSRFGHQVRNVPNLPQVGITEFRHIYEKRYLPRDDRHLIGRRYCAGQVVLSDGYTRDIWYLIEEGQGFAGVGDNVEFCVAGFDRWNVYNGRCRVLH
ncbi:hypothetical protein ABFT80_24165 [Mesorhizobium sp. SB112]|uniref:hypothetical protein n=1 Tax=Mesorhizobium sp. SB112 TaxID=3151853 RepID=UPI0032643914